MKAQSHSRRILTWTVLLLLVAASSTITSSSNNFNHLPMNRYRHTRLNQSLTVNVLLQHTGLMLQPMHLLHLHILIQQRNLMDLLQWLIQWRPLHRPLPAIPSNKPSGRSLRQALRPSHLRASVLTRNEKSIYIYLYTSRSFSLMLQ